jgi:hypothetical protein
MSEDLLDSEAATNCATISAWSASQRETVASPQDTKENRSRSRRGPKRRFSGFFYSLVRRSLDRNTRGVAARIKSGHDGNVGRCHVSVTFALSRLGSCLRD